jgi:hypothetical protein
VTETPGVRCERPGCRHAYVQHAPGGGNCMYWFTLTGEHCECQGFRWVSLADEPLPPRWLPAT